MPSSSCHNWLDIDVLGFSIPFNLGVDLILVCDLDEEAATVFKENSELKLVLTWRGIRINLLKILSVKFRTFELLMIQRLLVEDGLGHGVLNRSISKLFGLVDDQLGFSRDLNSAVNMEPYFRSNLDDKLLYFKN